MGRNITLKLDDETVRKARVLAAKRGTSVSGLIRSEIDRLVSEEEAFVKARRAALRRLGRGHHLGGAPLPSRDELHERSA